MSENKGRTGISELNGRLEMIPMLAIQRTVALNALRDADLITDGIMWVLNGIKRLVAKSPSKAPVLKHSFKH